MACESANYKSGSGRISAAVDLRAAIFSSASKPDSTSSGFTRLDTSWDAPASAAREWELNRLADRLAELGYKPALAG